MDGSQSSEDLRCDAVREVSSEAWLERVIVAKLVQTRPSEAFVTVLAFA